jgi:hypothetical protein
MQEKEKCLVDAPDAASTSASSSPPLESVLLSSSPAVEAALLRSLLALSENLGVMVKELRETNQLLQMSQAHMSMVLDEITRIAGDPEDELNGQATYLDGTPRN